MFSSTTSLFADYGWLLVYDYVLCIWLLFSGKALFLLSMYILELSRMYCNCQLSFNPLFSCMYILLLLKNYIKITQYGEIKIISCKDESAFLWRYFKYNLSKLKTTMLCWRISILKNLCNFKWQNYLFFWVKSFKELILAEFSGE